MTRPVLLTMTTALLLCAVEATRAALILPGPMLDGRIIAWDDCGMEFTALRSTTLERFTFENQGLADTVWLTDASGAVLATYRTAAGQHQCVVESGFPLAAGVTYQLISDHPDNGRWTSYSDYPVADRNIRVDGAVGREQLETMFWFSFTHLATTDVTDPPSTPEPAFAAPLVMAAFCLLRRRPCRGIGSGDRAPA